MATNVVPFSAPAQQPGLQAFIVFDHLPEGCIAFEVPDRCQAPHIHPGDFVVVDTSDREPMHGELFLYRYAEREPRLVEVGKFARPDRIRHDGKEPDPAGYWETYSRSPICSLGGREIANVKWADGPWGGTDLADFLKGRVVGLYQPDFRAQLRLASSMEGRA